MADPPPLIAAFLRKRADLVRFFTLRTGSQAAAEDLVQDLFVKISAADPPADLTSPEAYLYRAGTNLMLDRAKAARRRVLRDADWERARGGEGPVVPAADPLPDEVVDSRQRLQRLLKALDGLPPTVATAFRLNRFDGLSHGQVAERMGVSRSSVEKYIMTALRALVAETNG